MKKNRTMRIATLMLALTLITCCFVGSTFAKYTSSATASDSVTVAQWSFEVNDSNIATANTFAFDLFATAISYDDNGEDVNAEKLAPGTKGAFDIVLENTSEVSAKYAIDYTYVAPKVTVDGNEYDLPLKFSTDGGTTWKTTLDDVAADDVATKLVSGNGAATITVMWKWDYSGNDAVDTAFGITPPTVTVTAAITAEQVD